MAALELDVPTSKSVTHRALLLAAQSTVPCRVLRPLRGADNLATLACLRALGARAENQGDDLVFSPVAGWTPPEDPLDCGNSGTTLRLLAGQVARLGCPVTLTGDASLQTRPNGPLLGALEGLGVATSSNGGRAPLTLCGPLSAGQAVLPSRVSSQYASSLLLALATVPGSSTLTLEAPVASRPYLDLTAHQAAAFGLHWSTVTRNGVLQFDIPGGQRPRCSEVRVEGDWSGAAFPLLAGVLTGREVRLRGLDRRSAQGDRALVPLLRAFGQHLVWSAGDLVLKPQPLVAPSPLDLGATPDLFPALAVLAARAPDSVVLFGAPSLRDKECDRIAAMAVGLRALGAEVTEHPDGATFGAFPRDPTPAQVQTHHDHRVYMAFRVLAHVAEIDVDGAGCEAVSYPDFEVDLGAFS